MRVFLHMFCTAIMLCRHGCGGPESTSSSPARCDGVWFVGCGRCGDVWKRLLERSASKDELMYIGLLVLSLAPCQATYGGEVFSRPVVRRPVGGRLFF